MQAYRNHATFAQQSPVAPRRVTPWLALTVLLVGCNTSPSTNYSKLDLVEVTGQVTLDGVAVANARVEFEAEDGTASYGITDEAGSYRLMFNSEKPGCLPGPKVVRIRMTSGDEEAEEDPDAEDTSGITIPDAYNRRSTLTANVSSDQRTFDFALQTAGSATPAE